MKVVILAGGLGTRLSEETTIKPKPMVEIGGKPILWHIMKIYSHYGFNDFIVCLGYKGYIIKEWFSHYYIHHSDLTFDLENDRIIHHNNKGENWKVTLVDTGDETMTGGRVKRIEKYVKNETFMLTYGDGVSNVDINKLVEFHEGHGKLATITSITPEGRYGALSLEGRKITAFNEKKDNNERVNGGFFVLEPEIFNYIKGDETIFEDDPIKNLASNGQLFAHFHDGFWKAMDSLSDKAKLEEMWQSGNAPWKIWKEDKSNSMGNNDEIHQPNLSTKLRW